MNSKPPLTFNQSGLTGVNRFLNSWARLWAGGVFFVSVECLILKIQGPKSWAQKSCKKLTQPSQFTEKKINGRRKLTKFNLIYGPSGGWKRFPFSLLGNRIRYTWVIRLSEVLRLILVSDEFVQVAKFPSALTIKAIEILLEKLMTNWRSSCNQFSSGFVSFYNRTFLSLLWNRFTTRTSNLLSNGWKRQVEIITNTAFMPICYVTAAVYEHLSETKERWHMGNESERSSHVSECFTSWNLYSITEKRISHYFCSQNK